MVERHTARIYLQLHVCHLHQVSQRLEGAEEGVRQLSQAAPQLPPLLPLEPHLCAQRLSLRHQRHSSEDTQGVERQQPLRQN